MPKVGIGKDCKLLYQSPDPDGDPTKVAVDLGPTLKYLAPCWPDNKDTLNCVHAVYNRVGLKTPDPDDKLFKEFLAYNNDVIRRLFKPIDPEVDIDDKEWWLAHTHYSEKRKAQLRKTMAKVPDYFEKMPREWTTCKSFIKNEAYDQFKPPRSINSRTDESKVVLGPWIKRIEEVVYKHPSFVKHVPCLDRPRYVNDVVTGVGFHYYTTDHSRFESHMTRAVMNACELQLYDWVLLHFPKQRRILREVLSGTNVLSFRRARLSVVARRMSGDMCTSLGNGITNLLANLFVLHKSGVEINLDPNEPDLGSRANHMLVEGDDGLFGIPSTIGLKSDIYSKIGFDVKLISSEKPSVAEFCGLLYTSGPDYATIGAPLKQIVNFGWSSFKYAASKKKMTEILIAKCLSTICELGSCPIIAVLALVSLRRITSGKSKFRMRVPRDDAYWFLQLNMPFEMHVDKDESLTCVVDIDKFLAQHPVVIKEKTRKFFSEVFAIPIPVQMEIERRIFDSPWPYDFPQISYLYGEHWKSVEDMSLSSDLYVKGFDISTRMLI